jgi:quercetin dioxygenase-like cupin family protein
VGSRERLSPQSEHHAGAHARLSDRSGASHTGPSWDPEIKEKKEVFDMKLFCCALLASLVTAGASFAAGGAAPPIVPKLLADASLQKPFSLHVSKPGDLVVVGVKVAPGGSFGWHFHRSAVAVAVVSGTLTLYDSSTAKCAPQPVSAGQGFIEAKGHVHLARNEGTTPVQLYVTYLGAAHGVPNDVAAKEPANCSVT